MSLLTPLYILGLSAVVAPIIFHLIRRSPRGEVPFSSLMFLAPTPPRLTRRSRLDHLLLLLLRAAALCLLAFAFARPFLRQPARIDFGDVERRRIALVVDTSASMRRGDLWQQALARAGEVVGDCRPSDQLAIFSFDTGTHTLLSFHESNTRDPAERQAVARGVIKNLAPSWGGTNLAQALIDAVAAVEDVADTSEKAGRMPRRVVLVSDLSQGSRLEALGDFEWPSDVELELKTVSESGSNAGVSALVDSRQTEPAAPEGQRRVRVFNDASSRREQFSLNWVDAKGNPTGNPTDVYVPPGESRVVRVPWPQIASARPVLRLDGDTYAFDNTLYFVDERRQEAVVSFIGSDRADDSAGLLYYLNRVFIDTPFRTVRVEAQVPSADWRWDPAHSPPLVVVTGETIAANHGRMDQYVKSGGTLLYVVTAPGRSATLAAIAGIAPWDIPEGTARRDVLLSEIKFDHPLFATMAGAQFNDFTKIHFWKYRRIDEKALGDARVLARFETGDPAIMEKPLGKGRLVILASGWRPADSQLARSSKFVPVMSALLEARDPRPIGEENHLVFDRVPLPVAEGSTAGLVVKKPDGTAVPMAPGAAFFTDTDQAGLYTMDTAAGPQSFTVNLDPLESKTAPMNVETLEQFGCRLAAHSRKAPDADEARQMYSVELESRQKLWRWLILTAIGVLVLETWLAGRRVVRSRSVRAEALLS
jgi:hypothetical protein